MNSDWLLTSHTNTWVLNENCQWSWLTIYSHQISDLLEHLKTNHVGNVRMKNQMKLSSEMVAMPVTLQTGENEGRCLETYIKHTEISHVLCICTCMSTCMLDINMYVYNVSYIDKDTCLYNVCKNVSCFFSIIQLFPSWLCETYRGFICDRCERCKKKK